MTVPGLKVVSAQAVGGTGTKTSLLFYINGNCNVSGVWRHTFTEQNLLEALKHRTPGALTAWTGSQPLCGSHGPRAQDSEALALLAAVAVGRQEQPREPQQQVTRPCPGPPGSNMEAAPRPPGSGWGPRAGAGQLGRGHFAGGATWLLPCPSLHICAAGMPPPPCLPRWVCPALNMRTLKQNIGNTYCGRGFKVTGGRFG